LTVVDWTVAVPSVPVRTVHSPSDPPSNPSDRSVAPLGEELGLGLGEGDGLGLGDGLAEELGDGLAEGLGEGDGLRLGLGDGVTVEPSVTRMSSATSENA
jgi:hypothetical protein